MTILESLSHAYDRLPDVPAVGFSMERIGFCVSLLEDGSVAGTHDLRDISARKPVPRMMQVPASFKRPGTTPRAFFLWDKTSYALGVTAGDGKRLERERAAFVERHRELLAGSDDAGLRALLRFLDSWSPQRFIDEEWPDAMKDQNVVFALESERLARFLHERGAAKDICVRLTQASEGESAICLVSGEQATVARLHPAIKGVWGAQSSGASLISFNLDAFESYGHKQGDNAPVSEAAAFAYTTVLNRFLDRASGHRVQIGDASTVFWADASRAGKDDDSLREAEAAFGAMFGAEGTPQTIDEEKEAGVVGDILEKIRAGQPLADFRPDLAEGVRFHVLGLAPNAARLSVRFYMEDDFGKLAERYQQFVAETRIEPPPRRRSPQLWQYLRETAVLGKSDNVAPNLGGEWMRAILTGTRYPMTLLSSVLMRLRADGEVNALRVAILRALAIRNFKRDKEAPMAFDPENDNRGYLLGRLFAVYEQIQFAALGGSVNSTVKDKFYGSASAQPRKVFALLDRGSANHLAKVGKQSPGWRVNLEKELSAIMDRMAPEENPFPVSLAADEQALFGLGYYHQRNQFFAKRKTETATEEPAL